MYVLIDCDNFFVSCERAFQPKLNNRPVVVLSNNDGCVVARSAEAKTLGIPMGCPYFKIADLFREKHGAVLSSNYELYADMSHRVMNIIRSRLQNIEIYSVDEAFAEIAFTSETEVEIRTLRQDILRQTGISVSIGIAPTKTLCKIAGDTAKKMSGDKICLLKDTAAAKPLLPLTDIGDVWGVGRKLKPRLNFLGLFTAADLARAQRGLIRSHFGIHLEKTVLELNGTPCLPREQNDCQKSIICSRSFEHEITSPEELRKILAEFTDSACQRLRKQNSEARGIITYICTNRFNPAQPFYQNSSLTALQEATALTSKFLKAMEQGLKQIFRPGLSYKRAGITLTDINAANSGQQNFFDNTAAHQKEQQLMQTVDELNRRLGKKTIRFGSQTAGVSHFIRRDHKSRSYTTSWKELLSVR